MPTRPGAGRARGSDAGSGSVKVQGGRGDLVWGGRGDGLVLHVFCFTQ